jgi:hypothetical protein
MSKTHVYAHARARAHSTHARSKGEGVSFDTHTHTPHFLKMAAPSSSSSVYDGIPADYDPVPMDPLRRQCAGHVHRPVTSFPPRYWFREKVSGTRTYCAFCVEAFSMQGTVDVLDMSPFATISCDSHLFALSEVTRGPFAVGLVDVKRPFIPIVLSPLHVAKCKAGVGIIPLPTQLQYGVVLRMKNPQPDDRFVIQSMTIGSEEVRAFDGDHLHVYVREKVTVESYTPGGGNGLKFVSLAGVERDTLRATQPGADVLASYNKDNVIRIRLQQYRCIPSPMEPWSDGALFGSQLRQQSAALFGSTQVVVPHSYSGFSAAPPVGGGLFGFSAAIPLQFGFGVAPAAKLSGGTTIKAEAMTERIPTRVTRDTFELVGAPVEIVLQLACFQPDWAKELDNTRMAMHDKGYDYFTHQTDELDKACLRLRDELAATRERLYDARRHAYEARAGLPECVKKPLRLIDPTVCTKRAAEILAEDARARTSKLLIAFDDA